MNDLFYFSKDDKSSAVQSPKKTAAPSVPYSPVKSVDKLAVSPSKFSRNSPIRGSKVNNICESGSVIICFSI